MGTGEATGLSIRLTLATALIALLGVASAHGATVTVGSQLTASFSSQSLAGSITRANTVLPSPATVASPTDGTIVSWSYYGSGGFSLRLVRATGGASYTGAGSTGPAGTGSFGFKGPFAASLAIRRGDLIGMDRPGGLTSIGLAMAPGAHTATWNPALADGEPGRPPSGGGAVELGLSAQVRYCLVPSLKGKTPKTARAALLAADCTVGKTRKSKKRRKRKRVLRASEAAGTSVSDTLPIDLTVSRRRK